ncbi:hypothetical protein NHP21005_00450 [Helicobacter sp. NHP21005]|uniref:hypothetical protein n=1 Tax=Helicobacter felistomachi TaxID=3040201 RepID=UPI002573CDD0|nr:hypothetical protein [Helicobacter sp. NHP21005]BEG56357.1 hypothetical protein NHP21005_00450 [Helicobacter sp. NHP21005]
MVSKKLVLLGLAGALALAGCDKPKEEHGAKKEESHKEAPKTDVKKEDMKKEEVNKPGVKKEEGKPTSQAAKPEEGQAMAQAITDQDVAQVVKNALEDMLKDPQVQKIKGHNTLVLEAKNSTKEQIDTAKLAQAEEAMLKEQKKFVVVDVRAKAAKHPHLTLNTEVKPAKEGKESVLVLHLVSNKNGQDVWKAELPILHAEPHARAGR